MEENDENYLIICGDLHCIYLLMVYLQAHRTVNRMHFTGHIALLNISISTASAHQTNILFLIFYY